MKEVKKEYFKRFTEDESAEPHVIKFYNENREQITEVQEKFGIGSEQTPLNLFIELKNVDFKLLPYEFNMTALFQKEILDEELTFTKLGWMYQYSQIPDNLDNRKTIYWMKKTYEYFYGELKIND